MIAGIDYSTKAVDVVLLDEDSDAAAWHRFELEGQDAFDRARFVGRMMPSRSTSFWDDVVAVGIEDPRGYGAGSLYRIQGAILASIPLDRLVQPWVPSQWRKAVGLPGNASKEDIKFFASGRRTEAGASLFEVWPQDAYDAYLIALATRMALERTEAAA